MFYEEAPKSVVAIRNWGLWGKRLKHTRTKQLHTVWLGRPAPGRRNFFTVLCKRSKVKTAARCSCGDVREGVPRRTKTLRVTVSSFPRTRVHTFAMQLMFTCNAAIVSYCYSLEQLIPIKPYTLFSPAPHEEAQIRFLKSNSTESITQHGQKRQFSAQ